MMVKDVEGGFCDFSMGLVRDSRWAGAEGFLWMSWLCAHYVSFFCVYILLNLSSAVNFPLDVIFGSTKNL